jgi:hypothetical protein
MTLLYIMNATDWANQNLSSGVHRRREVGAHLKVELIDLRVATDTRPRELLGACVTVEI